MIISTSILNANHTNLEKDIKHLEQAGTDMIHIDIMDGIFVQYVTWGPSTVSAIQKITTLELEVHLMIDKPEDKVQSYINSGANSIIIHPESTFFIRKTLLMIKQAGLQAGLALKLETPVESIINCMDLLDTVILIACDEGFGGQPFNTLTLNKLSYLVSLRENEQLDFRIQVDGGINVQTGKKSKKAGADTLVAGSFILNSDNRFEAIKLLKNL